MLMHATQPLAALENASEFVARHIGIDDADEALMLKVIGSTSRRELIDGIVPRSIARSRAMAIPAAISEAAALAELKAMASKNKVFKNFIGQGYYGTHTPGVILRNILENPAAVVRLRENDRGSAAKNAVSTSVVQARSGTGAYFACTSSRVSRVQGRCGMAAWDSDNVPTASPNSCCVIEAPERGHSPGGLTEPQRHAVPPHAALWLVRRRPSLQRVPRLKSVAALPGLQRVLPGTPHVVCPVA